jgi:hypothetical protein
MPREENINPLDVKEASPMVGKYLCHVREATDGVGFAFCFGDDPEAKSGPLALCKIEQHGDQIQLRLYCNGIWSDKEEVIFEAT